VYENSLSLRNEQYCIQDGVWVSTRFLSIAPEAECSLYNCTNLAHIVKECLLLLTIPNQISTKDFPNQLFTTKMSDVVSNTFFSLFILALFADSYFIQIAREKGITLATGTGGGSCGIGEE
jgi:hypothetical protein